MKNKPYSKEIKQQAVELLIEAQKHHPSLWTALHAIAPKIGCTPESLRRWHQQPLAKQNPIIATTQSQADRIATLERENKELKQILKKATAFFAQTEFDRPHK